MREPNDGLDELSVNEYNPNAEDDVVGSNLNREIDTPEHGVEHLPTTLQDLRKKSDVVGSDFDREADTPEHGIEHLTSTSQYIREKLALLGKFILVKGKKGKPNVKWCIRRDGPSNEVTATYHCSQDSCHRSRACHQNR